MAVYLKLQSPLEQCTRIILPRNLTNDTKHDGRKIVANRLQIWPWLVAMLNLWGVHYPVI